MPGDVLVLGYSTEKKTEECPMVISTVYLDFPECRRLMDDSCSREQ